MSSCRCTCPEQSESKSSLTEVNTATGFSHLSMAEREDICEALGFAAEAMEERFIPLEEAVRK
jgi:hypothetical protein